MKLKCCQLTDCISIRPDQLAQYLATPDSPAMTVRLYTCTPDQCRALSLEEKLHMLTGSVERHRDRYGAWRGHHQLPLALVMLLLQNQSQATSWRLYNLKLSPNRVLLEYAYVSNSDYRIQLELRSRGHLRLEVELTDPRTTITDYATAIMADGTQTDQNGTVVSRRVMVTHLPEQRPLFISLRGDPTLTSRPATIAI